MSVDIGDLYCYASLWIAVKPESGLKVDWKSHISICNLHYTSLRQNFSLNQKCLAVLKLYWPNVIHCSSRTKSHRAVSTLCLAYRKQTV